MLEAFANESETANIERPVIAALSALTTKTGQRSRRGHCKHHIFHQPGRRKPAYFDFTNSTHTPEYSGEDGPSKRPTEQRNLPI